MGKYILALDQGTTSSRSLIYDERGRIASVDRKKLAQIFPKPGWVEQDPYDILSTQLLTAKNALDKAKTQKEVEAIGITNQRETTLLWEKDTGKPVTNAVVWQCRRSSDVCERLKQQGLSSLVHRKTGLLIDAYFSASKLLWLFEEYPELFKRAKRGELLFGTVDTWLLYNITGKHLTDRTNASRTMLFNIESFAWDDEIISLLDIPRSILPEVRPSGSCFGETKKELFGRSIPVMAVAGDQQAAMFGQGCFGEGSAKNTYGTGCFMLMHTGTSPQYSENGLITTCLGGTEGACEYALEGSVFTGGAVVQWLRDKLRVIENAGDTESVARSVEDNGGVFFVPAFVGLGAPHWNMACTGTITGITGGVQKAHIVRAALESIAFQSYDVFKCMEKDSGIPLKKLKVDGGASANDFLMQFQADLLGAVLERPASVESTSKGVFFLAGLGTGMFSGREEIRKIIKVDHEFHPHMEERCRAALIDGWQKAVQKTTLE